MLYVIIIILLLLIASKLGLPAWVLWTLGVFAGWPLIVFGLFVGIIAFIVLGCFALDFLRKR